MRFGKIVRDLMAAGLTQERIGKLCGVRQGHISELSRDVYRDPRWSLGDRLIELHKKHCRGKKAAKLAA